MQPYPTQLITLPQAIEILLRFPQKLGWLFRGQEDSSWELLPKAGRKPFYRHARPVDEQRPASRRNPPPDLGRFNHWRELAAGYSSTLPASDFDCLAYAQHYGLPTRLLDWTANALAALFFACEGHFDVAGAVYAYFPRRYIDRDTCDLYSFSGNACLRVPPFDRRILAQHAAFVLFGDPAQALSPSQFEDELKEMNCGEMDLIKCVIPAPAKLIIHRQLEDVGMTRRTLFPDLDGLSRDFVTEALYLEAFNARDKNP
ncbi:MAG: FRG domain-containing protein [Verrucomicrobiales bacterium]|nr:FRG domain-containing protein [Verrucomicrobiales bacterium]MCP5526739.1 FRG domain-containing protein [Verrucomicrobiales bacterium]